MKLQGNAFSPMFQQTVELVGVHWDDMGKPIYHGLIEDVEDGKIFLLFREHELEQISAKVF